MSQHRKHRGYKSQRIVADYLRNWWSHAEPVGAGRPGSDVTGVPFDIEIKARRRLELTTTMQQLADRDTGLCQVAVIRPDGYGPARIHQWPAIVTLEEYVRLFRGCHVP